MEKEVQKWLRLEEDGWQIVIPETDLKPHSTDKRGKERELAWSKCPCEPLVDIYTQTIIHNSFEHKKAVKEAMERLENPVNKP